MEKQVVVLLVKYVEGVHEQGWVVVLLDDQVEEVHVQEHVVVLLDKQVSGWGVRVQKQLMVCCLPDRLRKFM